MKFNLGPTFLLKILLLVLFAVLWYMRMERYISWNQMRTATLIIGIVMGATWMVAPIKNLIQAYRNKEVPEEEKPEQQPRREHRIKFEKPKKK